ncbi:MAG: YjbQ family protein [Deltaproteobacteria bacterium]|nr:YjbQ family protein [Deltaproteobacteria bacterium]
MKTLHINSRQQVEMIDITHDVCNAVREYDVADGLAIIFTPHTTAAITINENADPDVCRDIVMEINKMVPMQDGYRHFEGNSAAHIKSSLFGAGETLIINKGEVVLGTWQGIYFCEFDGPRQRQVQIQVVGR